MGKQDGLEQSLQRMYAAIERSHARQIALAERLAAHQPRLQERERRRRERRLRRGQRGLGSGLIFVVVAVVIAIRFLVVRATPWWWVWVAFGLGLSGMRQLTRYVEARREKEEPSGEEQGQSVSPGQPVEQSAQKAPAASEKPISSEQQAELARVDELCEKLLTEIRRGPDALKDVVRRPEEAVKGLREGVHALVKREQELRALVTAEDDQRLQTERAQLVAKLEKQTDEITRQRLAAALAALDEQLKQRVDLLTAATRLAAERTRLRYTLESLYTQVLRVRSADSASAEVAGVGVRESLGKLSEEITALAEALESVNRGEVEAPMPVSEPTKVDAEAEGGPRIPLRERG